MGKYQILQFGRKNYPISKYNLINGLHCQNIQIQILQVTTLLNEGSFNSYFI